MCTVTFIARKNGYALGMNRDEKLARVKALPPKPERINGRAALFPSEPGGGTWIGVNDAGATFALINWYSVPARVKGEPVSRGDVVKSSLVAHSPAFTDKALGGLPLTRVNPFRLIGVFSASNSVIEWRWNLKRLERLEYRWQTNTWISSGYDERGAQQTRCKTFGKALQQTSAGSVCWLRRLHRSHGPERGPYSTCMHREDAATVSYTEVIVARGAAIMCYLPGTPCCRLPSSDHRLALNH